MILFEAVAAALLLSLMTGGSLRNLEHERLRGEWVFLVLLPLQIAWPRVAELFGLSCGISTALWLLMMAALILVLMLNVSRRWILGVAALGIALNVVVISLNGAMPVSLRAVSEMGAPRAGALLKLEADCLHEALDDGTRARGLADVIAVPGPEWQRGVASVGDLLLAVGLGGWIFVGSRRSDV